MLGYSREKHLTLSVSDIAVGETPENIRKRIQETMTVGSSRFESRHRCKHGRIIDVEVSMTYLPQAGHILGFVRDITERKQAEAKIRASEEKYRLLFDTTEVLLSVYDREGICQLVNRRVAALFGGEPKDFIGKSIIELHPKDGREYLQNVRETINSGITREREDEVEFFKGNRWLLTRLQPLPDAQGVFRTVQIISQDITERKQSEMALQTSAAKYRIMTSTSMDGFVVVDAATARLLDVNEAYSRILGYSREELLTMSVSDVEAVDTPEEIRKRHHKTMAAGPDRFESRHRCKDGRIIDVEVSVMYVPHSDRVMGFVRDITERKRAAAALLSSNEKLLAECKQRRLLSKRLLDLLERDRHRVGMELHDHIGQTLIALKMDLEMIGSQLEQDSGDLYRRIKTAIQKTIQAVKDVKAVSHGLRPRIMLDNLGLVPCLSSLIDDINKHADVQIEFFSEGVPKQFEPEKQLALYRVCQEALTNVIKHAWAKKVFVALLKTKHVIMLCVEDDGVGFEEENPMRTSKDGIPMGLVIMQERMGQVGGKFSVESRIGDGTHLTAEIPI
jgi:PAS domain S-box-containing protein